MKEAENRILFESAPMRQVLVTLAIPTIIGQLVILIYNLADTFYIGQADNPYMMAGVSLILPIYNVCISLANISGVGGGSLISRLLGIHEEKAARRVSAFSLYTSIAFALLFSVATAIWMEPLLWKIGASPETYEYARQYLFCVIVLGGFPTILSLTLSNLLRSMGCAREAGIGVSMGGLLNIVLDPLFIWFVFPQGMEAAAVGVATMCSNVIACLYFFLQIRKLGTDSALTFSLREGLPEREHIRSIFTVGIPGSVGTILFDLDYIIIDRLTAAYGDIALAGIGIVLKAERLPLNVGIGLMQGMMPVAGYNYSAGNRERMRETVRYSRLAGLAVAAVSILLYQVFAEQIIRFFIEDAETVRIGASFLRVRCLATPFMFMSFHLVGFFQAVGGGRQALWLGVIRWAAFNIPMLFLLNAVFGMYGIVWAQMTADICTVIVSFWVYDRFWKRLVAGERSGRISLEE